MWFFRRGGIPPELKLHQNGEVPQAVTARSITSWGAPLAYYDLRDTACSGGALGELRMVIEIDQCGPFAGNGKSNLDLNLHPTTASIAWNPSDLGRPATPDCSKLSGRATCETFILDPNHAPDAQLWFDEAYWQILSLRAYNLTTPVSSPSPPFSPPPPSPTTPPPSPPWAPIPGPTVACNRTAAWPTSHGNDWIDMDTPADACSTISERSNRPQVLVFSDEFERPSRSFADGHDSRWTALEIMATGNSQINYYNASHASTQDGKLHIQASSQTATYRTGSWTSNGEPVFAYAPVQTAMVQSWNKFCFTGGIVEMSGKMPGKAHQPGLWPAFWLFGNLGRALYPQSTNGVWPFIFNEEFVEDQVPDSACSINQCLSQRIRKSDPQGRWGLHPYEGRGAPEIDILEVQPGDYTYYYDEKHACEKNCTNRKPDGKMTVAATYSNPIVSTSLQAAPGFIQGSDQRPNQGCVPGLINISNVYTPQWYYPELQLFNWGSAQSTYKVTPNYNFYGLPPLDIPTVYDHKYEHANLHTDAYSANTELNPSFWAEFHNYRVEWDPHPTRGYVRWSLDGKVQFQLDAGFLNKERTVSREGTPIGTLKGRQIPSEPMYVILNVDASPKWGWPDKPVNMYCTAEGAAARAAHAKMLGKAAPSWYEEFCENLDASVFEIEHVRVYQPPAGPDTTHYSIGCDTPEKPTRRYIAGHADFYKQPPPMQNLTLKKVILGGASCTSNKTCNHAGGGECVAGKCKCPVDWTGPDCTAQAGPAERNCHALETAPVNTQCAAPQIYPTDRLNHLMYTICQNETLRSGPLVGKACMGQAMNYTQVEADCAEMANTTYADNDYTAWASCVEALTDCSAVARANLLLGALHSDSLASGGGMCCNTYYTNTTGDALLLCHQTSMVGQSSYPNLDAEVRGVHYAPFIPGAAPGDNLYADSRFQTFVRDTTVLHDLGASTLVLEPTSASAVAAQATGSVSGYRQALYNATNYMPADAAAMQLLERYEQQKREKGTLRNGTNAGVGRDRPWIPLRLVPSLDIGPTGAPTYGIIGLDLPTRPDGSIDVSPIINAPTGERRHLQAPAEGGGAPGGAGGSSWGSQVSATTDATLSTEKLLQEQLAQANAQAELQKRAVEAALGYMCSTTQAFVRQSLTPAPATTFSLTGTLYGAGNASSKENTQAIELHMLPNDGQRWSTGGGLEAWLDYKTNPQWNLFRIVDRAGECAQQMQDTLMGEGILAPPRRPVLITLKDNVCALNSHSCVSAADFMTQYRDYKVTNPTTPGTNNQLIFSPPHVDGFTIEVSRSRGCNANAAVAGVVAQGGEWRKAFGASPRLWFSVGVDNYDTYYGTTYPAVAGRDDANYTSPNAVLQKSLYADTDARTECLLSLISSTDTGCASDDAGLKCGLVVREFADSYWRAVAGTSPPASQGPIAETTSDACATQAGSASRIAAAIAGHLPCGENKPCTPTTNSDCNHPLANRTHGKPSPPSRREQPQRLLCNPLLAPDTPVQTITARGDVFVTSSTSLPPCAHQAALFVDDWYNPAFDGLMEAPPASQAQYICNSLFQDVPSTLLPRRAYYALRVLWAEDAHIPFAYQNESVTVPSQWGITQNWTTTASEHDTDYNVGVFVFWFLVITCVLAVSRGLLGVCGGVAGRASTLLALVCVFLLNIADLGDMQLPVAIATTLNEVMVLMLLVLLWCPLNGGNGDWWWVHFALCGGYFTAYAGIPDYEFRSYLTLCAEYIGAILYSITNPLLVDNSPPPMTPPWDPCFSDRCCVRTSAGVAGAAEEHLQAYYFPWRSNMTVPDWWGAYLPWADVMELLLLTLLITLVLMIVACAGLQVLHSFVSTLGSKTPVRALPVIRRLTSNASKRVSVKVGALSMEDMPLLSDGGVYSQIDAAGDAIKQYFGEHFQSTALDATLAQVKGFVESRARRMQGYITEQEAAYLRSETDGASGAHEALSVAVAALERPTTMPMSQAAALWLDLTQNLRRYLPKVDFKFCALKSKGGKFAPITELLRRNAHRLSAEMDTLANVAIATGPTSEHWEVVHLYLLMGADNFFRATPELINLLFCVYYCAMRLNPDVGNDSAAPRATIDDFANLRVALYELQRHAGGKLGSRMTDVLAEKYMNFDDLGELATQNGASGLFQGLETLYAKMHGETKELLASVRKLTDDLVDSGSPIFRAYGELERAAEKYEMLIRMPAPRLGSTFDQAFFTRDVFSSMYVSDDVGVNLLTNANTSGNASSKPRSARSNQTSPLMTSARFGGMEMETVRAYGGSVRMGGAPAAAQDMVYNKRGVRIKTAKPASDIDSVSVAVADTPDVDDEDLTVADLDDEDLTVADLNTGSATFADQSWLEPKARYSRVPPSGAAADDALLAAQPPLSTPASSGRDGPRPPALPRGTAWDQRAVLVDKFEQLVGVLRKWGLSTLAASAKSLQSDDNVEHKRAKLLLEKLRDLIRRARVSKDAAAPGAYESTGSLVDEMVMGKTDMQVRLEKHAQQLNPNDQIAELSKLNQAVRDSTSMLLAEGANAFIECVTSPERFTWGRDGHKTFEERPGYDVLMLNSWFLWKALILLQLSLAIYLSGGYIAYAFALSSPSHWLTDDADDTQSNFILNALTWVLSTTNGQSKRLLGESLYSWMREEAFQGYAPFWLAGYLALSMAKVALGIVEDLLWLLRAISVDSRSEHRAWGLIANLHMLADPYTKLVSAVMREGARGRDKTTIPALARKANKNDTTNLAANLGANEQPSVWQSGIASMFSTTSVAGSGIARELMRLMCTPPLYVVHIVVALVFAVASHAIKLSALTLKMDFKPFSHLVSIIVRSVWLSLLVTSYTSGSALRRPFIFLAFLQLWRDVFTSLLAAYFSAVGPSETLFGCIRAGTLFGWYYDWFEMGHQTTLTRDRRTLKQRMLSSIFWVGVFGLKVIIEMAAIENFVRSVFTLSTLVDGLIQNGASFLQIWCCIVVIILRIAFSLIFFMADLQLMFAVGMAVSGSLTLARGKGLLEKSNLRAIWDRQAAGMTSTHLMSATAGILRRFPMSVGLLCDVSQSEKSLNTDNEKQGIDSTLLRDLWNQGLLRDLVGSHLIDSQQALNMRVDIGKDGKPVLPNLGKHTSQLCFEARRRMQAFLSSCSRTDTPVPALPIHSPSLTVLVPVYGETVVRSWPDMFREQRIGVGISPESGNSLANFEYMVERQLIEFQCLMSSLPPSELALVEPHVEGTALRPTALGSVRGLRDALWYSDYLLMHVKMRSALPLLESQAPQAVGELSEAARIAELMLQCATARSPTGGSGSHVVAGPSAPPGASREMLEDLLRRLGLAAQAIDLGIAVIDDVVEKLYGLNEASQPNAWGIVMDTLKEKQPVGLNESQREKALTALGVDKEKGWGRDRPAGAAGAPSELCVELWRTVNEARLKLKFRLWFSNREQTVWRTLSGLVKAGPAMRLLQQRGEAALRNALRAYEVGMQDESGANIATPASGPEPSASLPASLFTVMAALQNYGGWRDGKTKILKSTEKLFSDWSGQNDKTAKELSQALLSPGDKGLAALFDQCSSVALLVRRCPSMQVAYLPKVGGKTVSILCRGKGAAIGGAAPATLADKKGVELTPDPISQCSLLQQIRKIDLPGNPIVDALAEGKPINQANALLHCTSEIVMVNDMNQGADLEQWFFLPQLLSEFHTDGRGRYNPKSRRAIVGFKENIFTEQDGLVGRSGALNEFTFGTIMQRELHVTLAARLHYGHPDLFSFTFALVNGGTSKCSKTVHVSEDIFGGINVLARGGTVHYVDYMQVDKGRDVQYDAALGFEGKISGGTSVHTLSRDFFRLMGSPLGFFHRLSLFSGAFGYFWSNLTLAICVLTLAAMHGCVALLSPDQQFLVYRDTPTVIPLMNLGFVYLFALVVQYTNERGIKPTILAVLTVLAAIPLTLAKLKCHQYYAHRGLALGLAKYVPTGRDLATKRFGFKQYYERYAYSHLGAALDVLVLLFIFERFNALGGAFYESATFSMYLVAISWFFAPAINNPFGFTLSGIKDDSAEWSAWLHSEGFDDYFYGQKAGASSGELNQNNWFSWLNREPTGLKLIHAIARIAIYGVIAILILAHAVFVPSVEVDALMGTNGTLQAVTIVLLAILLIYAARVDRGLLRAFFMYAIIILLFVATLVFSGWSVVDTIWLLVLASYTGTKALLAVLELILIVLSAVPMWSDTWRVSPMNASSTPSSTAGVLLPRRVPLLATGIPLSFARLNAELQGFIFLMVSALIACFLALPISVVVALLSCIGGYYLIIAFIHGGSFSIVQPLGASALVTSVVDASTQGIESSTQATSLYTGIYVLILAVLLGSAWACLSGHKPRKRKRAPYNVLRFQLLTLRLNSLHDWLLMNNVVARNLAERAAVEST